jgi:hypothetical protein
MLGGALPRIDGVTIVVSYHPLRLKPLVILKIQLLIRGIRTCECFLKRDSSLIRADPASYILAHGSINARSFLPHHITVYIASPGKA